MTFFEHQQVARRLLVALPPGLRERMQNADGTTEIGLGDASPVSRDAIQLDAVGAAHDCPLPPLLDNLDPAAMAA